MENHYFKKTLAGIFAFAVVASATPLAPFAPLTAGIPFTASADTAEDVTWDTAEIWDAMEAWGCTSVSITDTMPTSFSSVISISSDDNVAATGGMNSTLIIFNRNGGKVKAPKDCSDLFNPNSQAVKDAIKSDKPDMTDSELKEKIQERTKLLVSVDCSGLDTSDAANMQFMFANNSSLTEIKNLSGLDMSKVTDTSHIFYGCENLESIALPSGVTSIGKYAFMYCTKLSSVTLPKQLKTIGEGAFGKCSSLKSIQLPDSLESIEKDAFSLSGLERIVIPASVTSIAPWVFTQAASLTTVLAPCSLKSSMSDAMSGCSAEVSYYHTFSGDSACPVCGEERFYEFDAATGTITKCLAKDEYVTVQNGNVTIPSTIDGVAVTSIGISAFQDCEFITSVTIPDSVTSIGESAFEFCQNLTSVTIPDSVTSIGKCAFQYCNSLTSVTIPDSVTSIGEGAFACCFSLKSIVIPDSVTSIGNYAFYECDSLKSITLPDSVTSIGGYAFAYCDVLTSIKIPASVSEIGYRIFVGDTSLTTVLAPCSLKSSMSNSMTDCSAELVYYHTYSGDSVYCACGEESYYEFDAATGTITKYLGKDENVVIPSAIDGVAVTGIGRSAFEDCTFITSVTIPDSVTSIGEGAFVGCFSLKSIVIPDSVTSIGESAFYSCISLESIVIPEGVTEICDEAFAGCCSLKSIVIPNSVTSINHWTFEFCTSLTSVTIPASVTSIRRSAFYNCSALKEVTFECCDENAIDSFNSDIDSEDIFRDCGNLTEINVPEGCAAYYKDSEGYKAALGDYINLIKEVPTAKAKGYSLGFSGDVSVNFYYFVSESYMNGYVKFGDGTVVYASDANEAEKNHYIFQFNMPAKNMYDKITAQFYDEEGNPVGDAVTFNVIEYMDAIKKYSADYNEFVDSFLEYGAQAAAYFGYANAPSPAKTYDYNSIISELKNGGYDVLPDMGDIYVGATLLLKSTPKLRLYYTENFDGAEQNEKNPDLYYIENEISPTLFSLVTLNGYSVYNYIYKALKSDDDSLKALCASLYELNQAANNL